jgi:spermidine/putrescine ABC transporter ATP-binding subunit
MAELELHNICKSFGNIKAVENLSFQVREGEFLSLLGPSGCGKTTTLRIIAGLEQQDKGEVLVNGREISNIPPHKRDVGFVFQDYALFPHMTVEENIKFGLKMKRVPKGLLNGKIQEILKVVGLKGYEKRFPKQLSGGEQQRVALCRALVLNPKILLLDEPLSNLDAKLRKRMRIELKNIQKKIGITAIYVTHDQEEALSMSDRIILMDKGQAVQIGTPYEIYEKPASRFVADFMGQVNCYEGEVIQKVDNEIMISSDQIPDVKALIPSGADYEKGTRVFFLIRKEGINILPEGGGSKKGVNVNSVIAEVQAAVYLGSDIEYICTFGEDKKGQVMLRSPSTLEPSELPGRGDKVRLEWKSSDVFLIEKIK